MDTHCSYAKSHPTTGVDHFENATTTTVAEVPPAPAAAVPREPPPPGCDDDPAFALPDGRTCATFVARVGRPGLLAARCQWPAGAAAGRVRDHCRKSCGTCDGDGANAEPAPGAAAAAATASTKATATTGTTTNATEEAAIPPSYKPTKTATTASTTTKPTAEPTAESKAVPATEPSTNWILEPNPYVSKFNTTEWTAFLKKQWEDRVRNAIEIREMYGTYCPGEPNVPMCPALSVDGDDADVLLPNEDVLWDGPTARCNETGKKEERCGRGDPWLNKTIWPLLRGPFCAAQDAERRERFPLPEELRPYMELGYDRADPTRSADAAPFDGGGSSTASSASANGSTLPFDPVEAKEHFARFEAMLEHHYEGLARPLLERQIAPTPDDPLYAPVIRAHADQIARAVLRASRASEGGGGEDDGSRKMVIGVLGDSVTSGTDNCYYDAWPEALRRQVAPLYAAMGIEVEVRNAAKNGGWNMASQLLCAHDMLGVSDRPDDVGLDFLFVCNPFVHSEAVDAEHAIRRALLGNSHTVLSITVQNADRTMTKEPFLERYARAGLTIGTPFLDAVPELGMPEKGYKFWFPDQSRAFWGMQGDGFCHLTTRAGSAPVVNRNWHWGPKVHQTYADAYALLLSRATRRAIDDLAAGRMPPEPPALGDYGDTVLRKKAKKEPKDDEENEKQDLPTWKDILLEDIGSEKVVGEGLGGVRCAVGSANQPGSTLLSHWLRPAEGSPFEEKMKSRGGASFVPADHDADGSDFYRIQSPISPPNNAVAVGGWVANPNAFGEEAPRTAEQCRHVDGSTTVNMRYKDRPSGTSWLAWEVPRGAVSIGRAMACHPRTAASKLAEDAFEKGDVRVHYAVPDGEGGWRVAEDAHERRPVGFVGQECTPVVTEMDGADVKAAGEGGMWIAVEWKEEGIFDFDYLVAM